MVSRRAGRQQGRARARDMKTKPRRRARLTASRASEHSKVNG